ncbi:acyl-ACP--UDP-N-acetylglucosamine O-acyltransferase [Variovorax sp. PCZ-1]|uniref:acyl-ACP--UDP-N-acetylglucosamine O-acyltransferase n=1 Tax=Variovorax sp. PCZ-1 TaxID=2835533 RepID=UPI001BCAFEFB|nr:acyl-ACP--UDP-N-acetylglucosamine O-acyltransferase [Variovorax sp. PCZ-1]MBS7806491.1 acyl-ACP--UDP-N-acetylglucosamine O-acyltransferase [Variovorax sp. PCZ-1]
MTEPRIHPTAIISADAELDSSVQVGAYSLIGSKVRIGAGTVVGPHCVIEGQTTIGLDNRFFQFSSIGAISQDIAHATQHADFPAQLIIGDRNTVREFCTFNSATHKEEGITRIGSDNWFMAYVHIAHDCKVGSHTIMANQATLAGHVHVGDWAVIGGMSGIHQFVHVGAHAMIGFQSHVAQDVPPFMTVEGHPLAVRAINSVGLKRRDFSAARLDAIKKMHRALYRDDLTLEAAKTQIAALSESFPEAAFDVQTMLNFLASATRGIVR